MKKYLVNIAKRLVAAALVITAVVGVSLVAMHVSTQNQNSVARSLKSIQTDKTTLFYAKAVPNMGWFVEQVLPGTGEGKAATENLRSVAATL
jgi:imidazoleglycerol phosphate synthase glutamine amidotransferase subunit HisH